LDGRHHTWTAKTLAEAVAKAESAIDALCAPYEFKRFDNECMEIVDEEGEADGSLVIYGPHRDIDDSAAAQDKGME